MTKDDRQKKKKIDEETNVSETDGRETVNRRPVHRVARALSELDSCREMVPTDFTQGTTLPKDVQKMMQNLSLSKKREYLKILVSEKNMERYRGLTSHEAVIISPMDDTEMFYKFSLSEKNEIIKLLCEDISKTENQNLNIGQVKIKTNFNNRQGINQFDPKITWEKVKGWIIFLLFVLIIFIMLILNMLKN